MDYTGVIRFIREANEFGGAPPSEASRVGSVFGKIFGLGPKDVLDFKLPTSTGLIVAFEGLEKLFKDLRKIQSTKLFSPPFLVRAAPFCCLIVSRVSLRDPS